MNRFRESIKLYIPPIILVGARKIRLRLAGKRPSPDFEGPYSTWQDAAANAAGWDAPAILGKTLDLSLKIRDGLIEFQQDLVEYGRIRYSETIIAFLAMASGMNDGKLDIVDFGGSLGTNFAQNRKLLRPFVDGGKCHWIIIERPPTVDLGRKHFSDQSLRFFATLDELKAQCDQVPTSFLFSGSMQYIEEPFTLLDQIIEGGMNLVAFDRLFVSTKKQHQIFIQHHRATYPTWCFSRNLFVETMSSKGFVLVEEFSFPPGEQFDYHRGPDGPLYSCGMIFAREKANSRLNRLSRDTTGS